MALGKNVSLEALRKKKEAKARRKRELEQKKQDEQRRNHRHGQGFERGSRPPAPDREAPTFKQPEHYDHQHHHERSHSTKPA